MMTMPPTSIVRLWDRDWNLKFTLTDAPSAHVPEQRILTLPFEHEASQWLYNGSVDRFAAYMSVDGPNGRFVAPLQKWTVERVGSCPQCEHCQEKVLRSVWRAPDVAIPFTVGAGGGGGQLL